MRNDKNNPKTKRIPTVEETNAVLEMVTPTGTTGYYQYQYPGSTRHYLDVKLAMLHRSNIKKYKFVFFGHILPKL